MICRVCGRKTSDRAVYCRHCGMWCASTPAYAYIIENKKDKWLLGFLAALAVCAIAAAIALPILWKLPSKPTVPSEAEPLLEAAEPNIEVAEPGPEDLAPIPAFTQTDIDIPEPTPVAAEPETVAPTEDTVPDTEIAEPIPEPDTEVTEPSPEATEPGTEEGATPSLPPLQREDTESAENIPEAESVNYSAKLKSDALTLSVGTSGEFSVLVSSEPARDAIEYETEWKSLDPNVATVADGLIEAVGEGNTAVIASVCLPDGSRVELDGSVTVTPAKPAVYDDGEAYITTEDYLISNSDSAYISPTSLQNLSKDELVIARNEIFARHGLIFKSANLRKYFESKSWYSGTVSSANFNNNVFNKYEARNLITIQSVEKSK